MREEEYRKLLNMSKEENEFNRNCINRFKNLYISKQTFVCVQEKDKDKWFKIHPDSKVYFIDEQEKTVVKIVDKKQMELIWQLYISDITEEEEKWLLDYKKSGYYYFKNFDDLKRWEKEIEKVYDKYESYEEHQKEIDIEKAVIAKNIFNDFNVLTDIEIEKD